jgi:hypothetical protein
MHMYFFIYKYAGIKKWDNNPGKYDRRPILEQ